MLKQIYDRLPSMCKKTYTVNLIVDENNEAKTVLNIPEFGVVYMEIETPDEDDYVLVSMECVSRALKKSSRKRFIKYTGNADDMCASIFEMLTNIILGGVLDGLCDGL